MILVVTPHLAPGQYADMLREALQEDVTMVESLRGAAALLRKESYQAVVLDQYLVETEPHETDMIIRQLGFAIPVQVNMGISGVARVAREVRAARLRRRLEEAAARRAAAGALQSELNSTMTALLLSCELALGTPGLSAPASQRIQSAHELVKRLRTQLEGAFSGA